MEQRLTPEFFMGSAIAALFGLAFGLLLHGPWQKNAGGPQIWFASAAAEALVQPSGEDDPVSSPQPLELADFDTGYVPPTPLPVTRLDPARFDPDRVDVRPAQADDAERLDSE